MFCWRPAVLRGKNETVRRRSPVRHHRFCLTQILRDGAKQFRVLAHCVGVCNCAPRGPLVACSPCVRAGCGFLWSRGALAFALAPASWLRGAPAFALAPASCAVLGQVRWIRAALAFALAAVSPANL